MGVKDIAHILLRIDAFSRTETQLEVVKKKEAFLAQAMDVLWKQAKEKAKAREVAKHARKVAAKEANWSGWALADVQAAVSLPIDIVNRSLLLSARLEKEGNLNCRQIIRFVLDHNRKMERIWEQMQELAANMTPAGLEDLVIPTLKDLATLV